MYREPYTCMKARLKLDINIYWPLIIIFVCLDMSGQFSVQAEVPPKLPEMALCAVCSTGGNTQKEPVKSWSKYQGEVFYFCSIGCKKHFDQDPLVIILGPIPRPLPDFSAQTLKGKTVHLKSKKYKKQLMLIDFWATWCLPCLESMPDLDKIQRKYKRKKLTVLGISLDTSQQAEPKIKKIIKKKRVSYPIWLAKPQPSAFEIFNLKSVPTMFLVNQQQQIVAQWVGKVDHETIKEAIDKQVQIAKRK